MGKSFDIAEFVPSDGLDPIVYQKLNFNFQRILKLFSDEIPAQLYNIDYTTVSNTVLSLIQDTVFDWIMPVGTVIAVEKEECAPKLGTWVVATEYNNRYVRGTIGAVGNGGRSNFTITQANIPNHTHTYSYAKSGSTFKVNKNDSGNSTAISSISYETRNTGGYGSDAPEAISLNPAYRSVIFMRRVE